MDLSNSASISSAQRQRGIDPRISRLEKEYQKNLERLVLTKHPFYTLKIFTWAIWEYLIKSPIYTMTHGWLLLLMTLLSVSIGVLLLTVNGPHEKHVDELVHYFKFGLWCVGLGVASSIGLGSGVHTFVLYLGPHIAFITIKATQCGRVDFRFNDCLKQVIEMESILGGSDYHREDPVHMLKTVQAHGKQKLHMVATIQVLKKVGRPSERHVQLKNRPVEHRCVHVTEITEVTGLEDAEADAEYDAALNKAIRVIQEVVTHINDQILISVTSFWKTMGIGM